MNILAKLASINQSGSLNLFSSKEVELEQRALLLKRLAFVIYCSNEDQYQKQVPDIQGIFMHCIIGVRPSSHCIGQ